MDRCVPHDRRYTFFQIFFQIQHNMNIIIFFFLEKMHEILQGSKKKKKNQKQ